MTLHGRTAVRLTLGGLVLTAAGALLSRATGIVAFEIVGTFALLAVLLGGGYAVEAIVRRHERSPLVWLALVPSLLTLWMLLAELYATAASPSSVFASA